MSRTDELFEAIDCNDIDLATELLREDSDLADSEIGTPPPIHWAIYRDNPQMVELLLDYGADIERRDTDRNATPLDYAIVVRGRAGAEILCNRDRR